MLLYHNLIKILVLNCKHILETLFLPFCAEIFKKRKKHLIFGGKLYIMEFRKQLYGRKRCRKTKS